MKLILASQSPRRKQLLEWAEVKFDVMVADTDETMPADMSLEDGVKNIALVKASHIAQQYPDLPVLAADTIVVCDQSVLGKPKDAEHALEMLKSIAGKTHQVMTGVALIHNGEAYTFTEVTEVTFHPLSETALKFYIDHYKPFDKAGAYAIQEWIGVVGIQSIKGDFYNVMGLPVNRIYPLLQQIGVVPSYQ
jgi:septum formation protein